jgi:kumamolisin
VSALFGYICAASIAFASGCGHIAEVDVNGGATQNAASPNAAEGASKTFTIGVALHFRNETELDSLLGRLYDPNSPDYGKFLTPEQFQTRFGPAKAHVDATIAHLQAHGMVVSTAPHGQFITAKATVPQAERAFGTRIAHKHDGDGRMHRVLQASAKLPTGVAHVHNLATSPKRHTHVRAVANPEPHGVQPLTGKQIRSVYNVAPTMNAKTRNLALVELDGYDPADVAAYAKQTGISMPHLKDIRIGGYDGAILDPDAQVEVTMDIELMAAMAGQVGSIRVYQTSQDKASLMDLFNEIANPTIGDKMLVHIISCSWGLPESDMTLADARSESIIFKQMAAQGQTVFAASGDSGALDDGQKLGTDDPASQPYVVAVGGTTLNSHNGVYVAESAWFDGHGGGGGGTSMYWPIPSWQKGMASAQSQASTTMRNVPDVALNADPQTGYLAYVAGRWVQVGGTSCAAPIWAGYIGAVNEGRVAAGKHLLGFLSPILYSVGRTPAGHAAFHDVTDMSTNGYYPAVPGFDDATGFGSMDGQKFYTAFGP